MTDFTASNGMTVSRDHDGDVVIGRGTDTASVFMVDGTALALHEFFRAEEDERLGRWRWPENPDYVVYEARNVNGDHKVLDLTTGYGMLWGRDMEPATQSSDMVESAARAYFDAHPEPKPWHDAAEGEVWVLMFPRTSHVWFVNGDYFQSTKTLTNILKTDPGIISARRIWPEDAA